MLDIQIQAPFPILQGAGAPESEQSLVLLTSTNFDVADGPFAHLDAATGGALRRAVAISGYKGEREQSCVLLAPCAALARLVLIGCGADEELDANAVEAAGGQAAQALKNTTHADIAFAGRSADYAAHAAYGAVLNQYRFDLYHSPEAEPKPRLQRLTLGVKEVEAAQTQWRALEAVAQGVIRARDLVTEPPNVLTPPEFARRIETLRDLGVDVEVMDSAALRELGFGALLGVAQGSEQEARLVVMRYRGSEEAPLAFIGKGVTFDSGGISIKPAAGMDEMKTDMGGAATVVGLLEAVARRKARTHVIGLVGLVENMVSGNAQRPGDVVKSYSGQTIEVLNTDAEGRLVLADVLAYARDRFQPRFMVDLATLTGAIVVSLGHARAGLFSNDDALAEKLFALGENVGENVWRMPMGKAYDKLLRSDIADMKNITGRPGSAITAAQFLARFVKDTPWAHLDIAGVAWRSDAAPLCPKGATGFGVRLLDALVQAHETGPRD
ncbi:leucyl aminopeptidase [Kozakia baliensis]|uniref:Probable cytosol aminopeptidase n=1 Tax=Kozakia baliensis TaxID=153496 RepID=A0A1D8UQL6_9PROT|nr:leucyl aminopeptidase [Kozakia baliensis]AOX15924.1 leucyl aminopeptidase [Kozakia baliensis]GBR27515.1 leucyl/cytosol aminopeptidase [Kozakia baliensis NRIC 0488]GEL64189.1 putative cytosol aminopeptidase [Kozakia baliensis]